MAKEGGFECEFVETPPKAVQSHCPMCLLVLREPYQATCCGYSFCRTCIERVKAKNISCPCCQIKGFDHYPNKGLQRSLNEFKVYCSNKPTGCEWEGELGQLDNHLNYNPTKNKQLEGCQYSQIKCCYCPFRMKRSEVEIHQREQCLRRPFKCHYCKDFASSYVFVTTNHWFVCDYYPMMCPKNCGQTLQRQNLQSHITTDCPLTIIDCDFKHVGCEVRLPRKDMPAHLQEGVVRHVSLQAVSYKQEIATLKEENKELKQLVSTSLRLVEKLTNDLQAQNIYTLTCPVEFTLTNVEQKIKLDECWRSPPFYTHLKGYKMHISVYLNGDGKSQGTHTSIFIRLMKGEFDDKLKWPLEGKIEIVLLDQDQFKEQYKKTVEYSIGEAGNRVFEGEKSIVGRGFFSFITKCDLRSKHLIVNDCLKLRINYSNS